MLSIVILNTEKLNSQVIIKINKLAENSWSITLNNITKNTYRIFLESYIYGTEDKIISRESSMEFHLHPGTVTVTENEIGPIITKHNHENVFNSEISTSNKLQLAICVRQKYGPDLGFINIEL